MTVDRNICAHGTCPRDVVAGGRCAEHAEVPFEVVDRAEDGDAAVMGTCGHGVYAHRLDGTCSLCEAVMGDECACGAHGKGDNGLRGEVARLARLADALAPFVPTDERECDLCGEVCRTPSILRAVTMFCPTPRCSAVGVALRVRCAEGR